MIPPSFWDELREFAEPFELMKFTLIYDGEVASAGNKSQPVAASKIRNAFHDQLADLWDSHVVFRQLARTARTIQSGAFSGSGQFDPPGLPDYREPIPALRLGQTNYCAPIEIPDIGRVIPLVRNSLYLTCALDILFLRHEEPMTLMKQGGDLDGRLKTLFDALRMPSRQEFEAGEPWTGEPLYVLLEDDALISDFSVKSGRLLGERTKKRHAVRLTIDVTIKVLRVFPANQCLTGD